ncbi:hypothetical protein L9F63_022694, partial [Diploptera punctata]
EVMKGIKEYINLSVKTLATVERETSTRPAEVSTDIGRRIAAPTTGIRGSSCQTEDLDIHRSNECAQGQDLMDSPATSQCDNNIFSAESRELSDQIGGLRTEMSNTVEAPCSSNNNSNECGEKSVCGGYSSHLSPLIYYGYTVANLKIRDELRNDIENKSNYYKNHSGNNQPSGSRNDNRKINMCTIEHREIGPCFLYVFKMLGKFICGSLYPRVFMNINYACDLVELPVGALILHRVFAVKTVNFTEDINNAFIIMASARNADEVHCRQNKINKLTVLLEYNMTPRTNEMFAVRYSTEDLMMQEITSDRFNYWMVNKLPSNMFVELLTGTELSYLHCLGMSPTGMSDPSKGQKVDIARLIRWAYHSD